MTTDLSMDGSLCLCGDCLVCIVTVSHKNELKQLALHTADALARGTAHPLR